MPDLDSILNALEAVLDLERELGKRTLEIDRSLLANGNNKQSTAAARQPRPPAAASAATRHAADSKQDAETNAGKSRETREGRKVPSQRIPFTFLVDPPPALPDAVKMMDGIIAYMEKETGFRAGMLTSGDAPAAKVLIAMGNRARNRWFKDEALSPGKIVRTKDGRLVAWTRSPEEVVRYGSPKANKPLRVEMMKTFKSVQQRITQ